MLVYSVSYVAAAAVVVADDDVAAVLVVVVAAVEEVADEEYVLVLVVDQVGPSFALKPLHFHSSAAEAAAVADAFATACCGPAFAVVLVADVVMTTRLLGLF